MRPDNIFFLNKCYFGVFLFFCFLPHFYIVTYIKLSLALSLFNLVYLYNKIFNYTFLCFNIC